MKMGNLLRDFEIRSDTIRFPTGQAKGYYRSDFTDAWNRYCPEPKPAGGEAVPAVPAVTSQVSPEEASPLVRLKPYHHPKENDVDHPDE